METKLTLEEFQPATHNAWRESAEAALNGRPFEKALCKQLPEDLTLQPIYDPETAAPVPETWPGVAPFLRGNFPGNLPCRMAQEIATQDPEEFRSIALDEIRRGQNAVSVSLSVAYPNGLKLLSAQDLRCAFEGVVSEGCPVYARAGATALPLAALVEGAGLTWHGGLLADPLTAYATAGTSPTGLGDFYNDLAEVARWNLDGGRALKTVGIEASAYAEAGCNAVEELAMLAATAAESLRQLIQRGIAPADAAPQFMASVSLTSKIFVQIAKVRAARLIWATIVSAFDATGVPLEIHGRTSRTNKSVLDAHTNMLRVTAEAFAGIVAGVGSLQVAPYDELTGEPTEFSRRIARNVPIILLEEAGLGRVADAAGGSWYVESLTQELAGKAWKLFQEVEAQGGMAAALRAGVPQQMAAKSRAALRHAVASRREPMIGVNLYPNPQEVTFAAKDAEPAKAWPGGAGGQVARSIHAVKPALEGGLMLNEVACQLKRAEPSEPDVTPLAPIRAAKDYEDLRTTAFAFRKKTGALPVVWLAKFGPPKHCKARADFSEGFFAAGGFVVKQGSGAPSAEDAVAEAKKCGAPVVVVCSSDPTYPEIVPAFVPALKMAMPAVRVFLAGQPGEHESAFREAGVDDFIHLKVNCYEFLNTLHNELGL